MEDARIIALFFARDQQAIAELDSKYGGVCRKLSQQILRDPLDAEECVNDAYLGAWNAIPPARPDPLRAFLCKLVRNLSIKRYHANTALKRNSLYDVALSEVERDVIAAESAEDEADVRALTQSIEAFLDTLSAENRVIFLRRYWFADSYEDIARRVGLTEKNVSVRLTRLRRQLREQLAREGVLT